VSLRIAIFAGIAVALGCGRPQASCCGIPLGHAGHGARHLLE
jgi:hypothetical protein